MACSKQMHKESSKTGAWSAIFPTEQVTEQQSTLFVKKLLAVAVSNITYLRTIFPEHAFGDRCLEDLNLKILRDDSACPGACQVIQWVKGCFDALDKKYLRMIVIGIYEDASDPNTIVESYSFKFSYTSGANGSVEIFRNGQSLASAHSTAETRKATIKLLRTIVVLTQTLKPLPDEVLMTMKLLYYDDVTPPDYQPPGFQHTDACEFLFKQEPLNIKVGDVSTNMTSHGVDSVQLRIKTDASQFELKENEEEGLVQGEELGAADDTISSQALDVSQVLKEDKEDHVVTSDAAVEPVEAASSVEPPVCCPCGCNEDDGLMVLCAACNCWQHAVCFGLLSEGVVPEEHICDKCSNTTRPCTDPFLQYLSPVAVQATCLWRRTLLACTEVPRLLTGNLANRLGVGVDVARGLMTRLEREGLIKAASKGKRLGKLINKDKVEQAMKKYIDRNNKQANDNKPTMDSQEVMVEDITQHTSRIDLQSNPVKRVRSLVDQTAEFELSCSQSDVIQDKPSKRHKASIASKAILV